MLAEILGQSVAVQTLRNYLSGGMVSGPFLFVGPMHVGKAFAASQFAAALLCEGDSGGLDACGVCASCRMAAGNRHPDLRTVRPSGASRILAAATNLAARGREGVSGGIRFAAGFAVRAGAGASAGVYSGGRGCVERGHRQQPAESFGRAAGLCHVYPDRARGERRSADHLFALPDGTIPKCRNER